MQVVETLLQHDATVDLKADVRAYIITTIICMSSTSLKISVTYYITDTTT